VATQPRAIGARALHPTRPTDPKPASQLDNDTYPARVAGNDSTPTTPPLASSAAATWLSRCVSTPPVTGRVLSTMATAIPSSLMVQGVARTSREGDRVEPAVGPAGSVTLQNGACLVPAPRPSRQAPQPARYNNQSNPTAGTADRIPTPSGRWTPDQRHNIPSLTRRIGVPYPNIRGRFGLAKLTM
jgi:hypothetical protein